MNIRSFFSLTTIVATSYAFGAMDPAAEIREFVRPPHDNHEGINIGQAYVGIRDARVAHHHVPGEHLYRIDNHLNQEYNQNEPFMRQMFHALLSGAKQSFFETGNCGGKFIDYATKFGASLAVGLTIDATKKICGHLFSKHYRAQQKAQEDLTQLAQEEALVNSLAVQLKNLPRQTETEKEIYKTIQAHYASMLEKFSRHAHDYMTTHNRQKVSAATA